jgi:hypothetical protein
MEWSPTSIGRNISGLSLGYFSDQRIVADDTIMTSETSAAQAGDGQRTASAEKGAMIVFYDGSCPLCSAEIEYYRRMDTHGDLLFRDVSKADVVLDPELDRINLMARFHVRRRDGALLSGAAAFVSLWSLLPHFGVVTL